MAVLEKIRVKFGILISILIAVALLSFILDPQTLSSASRMFSSDNQVGKMDGKSVSYQDFYEEYDKYTKLAEMLGQGANSEEAQSQLRDAAWQSIFDQQVFIPQAEKAGIFVSDAEMYDLTQGSQVSPVLAQQQPFLNENGTFSREAFVNFVQSIDADETGASAQYYDFLEDEVYRTQLYTKYGSLISGSALQSDLEKSRLVEEGNTTADIDYILVSTGFTPDTSKNVSGEQIKKYYNEHKHLLKQPASRDIEYVMWEVVPSAEDVSATREEFDALYEQFKTAENLRNFVTLNSDSKFNSYYFTLSQIEGVPEFVDLVEGKVSGVSEVHVEENSFMAARIVDTKVMPDSLHLFYAVYPLAETAKADSLAGVAKKSGMTSEFKEIGWFTQEVMQQARLEDFAPLFTTDEKVSVIRSANAQANFVVYVSEKTKPVKKFQLATLLKNVLASDATYRDFQMKAASLADASDGDYKKFSQIVSQENLPVIPMTRVLESTRRVGQAENARELVRWIFEKKTKVGTVSDVITVDNKYYFVAAVTAVHKEGISSVSEVSQQIASILSVQNQLDEKLKELSPKAAQATSLETLAEELGTTVSHANGISFASLSQAAVEPALVGAASAAEEGKIGIVKGQIGVYIYKVSNRQKGSFYSESDAATAAKRSAQYQSSIATRVITDKADVKDHRSRFF
ncbi:MAG: SurA N-terminal domain-containing protein [Bacteroidales bacterium]|nr:SurA N-terminal domain-containing protein [Candidatus Cacconaster equifaecalis]